MREQIQLPGWKIIRIIGQGSFGSVYEIEKEDAFGNGLRSALKVISIPESDSEIEAYRYEGYDEISITKLFKSRVEDITNEFMLMSKLRGHSNIVSYEDHTIIQHDHDPGYDILIRMELLTSLSRYFTNRAVSDEDVRKLGIDICRALELCSRYDIIHRDIKPQNIFVNDNGDFKLGDFGIAKTLDHTTKATKAGTYSYMAPEVYWGKQYNASVDLYSLGMVLYEMLNERRGPFLPYPPIVVNANQREEAQKRRMSGEPLPAPKHGSGELKRIVLKACAADPKDRYASPTEMKYDLENVLRGTVRTAMGNVPAEDRATVRPQRGDMPGEGPIGAYATGQRQNVGNVPTGNRATVRPQRGDMPGEGTIGAYTTGQRQSDPDGTVNLFRQGQKYAGNQSDPDATVSLHRSQTTRQNTATVNSRAAFTAPPTPPQNRRTEWEQPNVPAEKTANKKTWIPVLIAAIIVLILFTAITVLLLSNCNSSKTKTAYTSSTPTATVKTTTGVSGGGTVKSTPTPTSKPTPELTPTPTKKAVTVTYSLDAYFNDISYEKGKRYSLGDSILLWWNRCTFFGETYGIKVNGSVRNNAILFYVGDASKSTITIEGTAYIQKEGYFELPNPGNYEQFSFSLGAVQEPKVYYKDRTKNGLYRLRVEADGKVILNTGWLDYLAVQSYNLNIAGTTTMRFILDQTYGSEEAMSTLNIAIYDASFSKTE